MSKVQPVPLRTPFLQVDQSTGKTLNIVSGVWARYLSSLITSVQVGVDTADLQTADETAPAFASQFPPLEDIALGNIESLKREPQIDILPAHTPKAADWIQRVSDVELLQVTARPGSIPSIQILQDTFANRVLYPPAAYPEGAFFRATNFGGTVVWQARQVAGVMAWVYASGTWVDTLANIPTASLGVNDAGLPFWVSDYSHMLAWGGAAWGPSWAPGNPMPSGLYAMFDAAPSGDGALAWQLCNGATVARLNPDGTVTNVALDDVTTAAYLKAGITPAAIAAASGNTPTGTVSAPAFLGISGATSADSGGGTLVDNTLLASTTTVASHPHDHTVTPLGANLAPVFTGNAMTTLELRQLQKALYFRR